MTSVIEYEEIETENSEQRGHRPEVHGMHQGGLRGYSDACAIETHSNTEFPTVKTMGGFMVVGIMREDDEQ